MVRLLVSVSAGLVCVCATSHAIGFHPDVAKFYFVEYAYALQYIHRNMLTVFRDLKPENILLDHCGHLRIIDFGFAVKLDQYVALDWLLSTAALTNTSVS